MYETFLFDAEGRATTDLTLQQIEGALNDEKSLLWVDIKDPNENDVDLLSVLFKLHPLTIEDCIMPNTRPKIENFPGYLFTIMYAIELHPEEKEKITTVELDFILGRNFLISVHSDFIKSVATIKERAKKQYPGMANGVDFLFCSIVDSMVDNYFPIINMFDDKVDDMSDELFRDPTQDTLRKIYNLKNEMMILRRTIGPQADVISVITRGGCEFISQANVFYFRNVYDNLVRLNDIIGTSRDTITGALEVYVSVVSNRLNEIMKTLTVIATIMMPLTLIASVYGMNFKFMPELDDRYAYPAVLGVMFLIAIAMLYYFKRKKWL